MYFYVFQDSDSRWRWALFDANDRKIAESAEGYPSIEQAGRGIGLVLSTNSATPVVEG